MLYEADCKLFPLSLRFNFFLNIQDALVNDCDGVKLVKRLICITGHRLATNAQAKCMHVFHVDVFLKECVKACVSCPFCCCHALPKIAMFAIVFKIPKMLLPDGRDLKFAFKMEKHSCEVYIMLLNIYRYVITMRFIC